MKLTLSLVCEKVTHRDFYPRRGRQVDKKEPSIFTRFFCYFMSIFAQKLICFFVTLRGVDRLPYFIGTAIKDLYSLSTGQKSFERV
jgi:uncharacterized membrane protein YdjX (TVP38/TMEM64 family)